MLEETLKKLNYSELKEASSFDRVGCPFNERLNGPIQYNLNCEDLCSKLCGALYPKGYKELECPCNHMNKKYVKRKFWKEFHRIRG